MKLTREIKGVLLGFVLLCTIAAANGLRKSEKNTALAGDRQIASLPVSHIVSEADKRSAYNAAVTYLTSYKGRFGKAPSWMPRLDPDEIVVDIHSPIIIVEQTAYYRFRIDKPAVRQGVSKTWRNFRLVLQKQSGGELNGVWIATAIDTH